MTANPIEKARVAAEKAAQELATLEAAEAEKAAQKAVERDAKQRELAGKFIADLPALETRVKGDVVSDEAKAAAFAEGNLPGLVADFLARRAALSTLRDHVRRCCVLLGEDDRTIAEVRHVDPAEELRRWTEAAMDYTARNSGADMADAILAEYEVS
jgi:hypothetical protein